MQKSALLISLQRIFTALTCTFYASASLAQLINGDFEAWSNGSPTGWSVIDSGVSLSQVASPVVNGGSAAAVIVSTSTQSQTDLQQSITVAANQPVVFKASVYHTEGRVRARLVVNGYRVYSDPSIRNQWQQLSFEYTPTQAETISVGLRFYDVSGFDGSEIVYVDDFQPRTNNTPPADNCGTETTLTLVTDNYGTETSWSLHDAGSQLIASGSGYSSNQTITQEFCLIEGDYTFTIHDTYGDGLCCQYGNGSYRLATIGETLASGGQFAFAESTTFKISSKDGGNNDDYYQTAEGLTGYQLKTALYNIIKGHAAQGYGALWGFYAAHELDYYFENDGSILDIYSENPAGADVYTYTAIGQQCGSYNGEGDCYNREHSFPRSWFGGSIEPMNSDVHHIFASDGFVNSKRGSLPYGEVGNGSYVSANGSRAGSGAPGLGYGGDVFEPNDEFKGDVARAQFYMATRYQNSIANWENNSATSDAALNGSSNQVFEPWYLALLKQWHSQDPVSQKERDRNDAAQIYQGNRNPFVDRPGYVAQIWGD